MVLDEKISQLKAQRQSIVNREREKERKNRTRRLIQNGALAEQYLQCNNLESPAFEAFLSLLSKTTEFKSIVLKCKDEITLECQRLEKDKQSIDG